MSDAGVVADSGRLETLSDTVFGLSATLLVVSLEVPRTFSDLMNDLKGFVGFGLSFAALMLVWTVHKGFFRRFPFSDNVVIFLNASLLFLVLFFVFPLKFLALGFANHFFGISPTGGVSSLIDSHDQLATLFMLYGGAFFSIFLCISLLYAYVWKRRMTLVLSGEQSDEAGFYATHYLVFSLVALVSVTVAWTEAGIHFGLPGFVYFLIGPLCAANALMHKHLGGNR